MLDKILIWEQVRAIHTSSALYPRRGREVIGFEVGEGAGNLIISIGAGYP